MSASGSTQPDLVVLEWLKEIAPATDEQNLNSITQVLENEGLTNLSRHRNPANRRRTSRWVLRYNKGQTSTWPSHIVGEDCNPAQRAAREGDYNNPKNGRKSLGQGTSVNGGRHSSDFRTNRHKSTHLGSPGTGHDLNHMWVNAMFVITRKTVFTHHMT